MKRYFYTGNRLTKTWLDHQYNMVRMEDQVYRDALLAVLKLEPEKKNSFLELKETMLNMTISEQNQYANNYHMEALFKHFDSLHRNTRGRKMIMRGKESLVKDLVDPDKFPIWDLKKKPTTFFSIWNSVMGKIRYDIGHQLVVKNSLIEHPEGGRGVFVSLPANKNKIQVGEFIGLIPGSIYDSYESYKKLRLDQLKTYERIPQHLHFPSGKVLELSQYQEHDQMTNSEVTLQPCMVNPYSLGQFINHPPYGQKPNVIFTEIECNLNFFPNHLKKYLPYNEHLPLEIRKKNSKVRIYAAFAREPILHNEELYVDYCENHIYPIHAVPEWMTEPDYSDSLNFSKEEYEHPSPEYWKLVEKQALSKNQELYQKYLKTVHYRPSKVLYQDGEVKIRGMSMSQTHPVTKE